MKRNFATFVASLKFLESFLVNILQKKAF